MALQFIDGGTLPTNELTPLIGCGLRYCLEETEYEITAGLASFIPIVFNFYDNIANGDVMVLHGVTFTFVTASPANANQIQINGLFTAANVFTALSTYPFFADNYTITQPNQFEVHIQSDTIGLDENYGFSATTANPSSILINPFYPPASITAGLDPVVKDEYYVALDVFDVLAGEEKICSSAFSKPLMVFADGSNKVCFDVQKIIEDYGNIYSSPPAPNSTLWNWIESNFVGQFRFRFVSSYKDSDSIECERTTGTIIKEPNILGLRLYVANMVLEPDADYTIEQFSFFDAPALPILPITIHPEDYQFCTDSIWEWRVDFPVNLIQTVFGGLAQLALEYNYTDGSTDTHVLDFTSNTDGIQIIIMALGQTLPATDPAKTLQYIASTVQYSILANPFVIVAQKNWYFDLQTDKCCKCHKQFYFLSKLGNNETIIAKCDTTIDFESEFFDSYKEVQCGGETFLNTSVYDGGAAPINLLSRSKIHTVLIECQNPEYLEAFLESPVKFVYEDGKVYRIVQLAASYTIYQVNDNRFRLQFQYKKSIDSVRRHFSR